MNCPCGLLVPTGSAQLQRFGGRVPELLGEGVQYTISLRDHEQCDLPLDDFGAVETNVCVNSNKSRVSIVNRSSQTLYAGGYTGS